MKEDRFFKTVMDQYLLSIYSVLGAIPSLFHLSLSLNSLSNSIVTSKMDFQIIGEGKTFLWGMGWKY